MTLYQVYQNGKDKHGREMEHLAELQSKMRQLNETIMTQSEKKNQLENKLHRMSNSLAEAKAKDHSLKDDVKEIRKQLAQLQDSRANHDAQMDDLQTTLRRHQDELTGNIDLNSQEEIAEMEQLLHTVKRLKIDLRVAFKDKSVAEKERNSKKNKLEGELLPTLEEMRSKIGTPGASNCKRAQLDTISEQQEELKQVRDANEKAIEENDAIIKKCREKIDQSQVHLDQANHKLWAMDIEIQNFQANMPRLENGTDEEISLLAKLNECNHLLASHSVPETEIDRYRNKTSKECRRALAKINKKLTKHNKVNMKAHNMHEILLDKRRVFASRIKEYAKGIKNSETLVERLETLKDSKVDFTFRQVSKYFSEIFQILVPSGKGSITFDRSASSQEDDGSNTPPSRITIHVAFDAGKEMSDLNQVSRLMNIYV